MRKRKQVHFLLARSAAETGSSVDFTLYEADAVQMRPGHGASGKLDIGDSEDAWNVAGIWRMGRTRRGKVPTKNRWYRPTNPRSEPQQANRAKFAAAMTAWQALTTQQRQAYAERAKKIGKFGWGLFIREYYQSNP